MQPYIYTNEAVVKTRIEDHLREAQQRTAARLAAQTTDAATPQRSQPAHRSDWLRRLAARLMGAGV